MKPSFIAETLWSSSLQKVDLPRIRAFLKNNGFENIDVALASPQGAQAARMRWVTYYDSTGRCHSLPHDVPIPVGSMFLKMAFSYQSADEREAGRVKSISIANTLRLIFGTPVARELVLVMHGKSDSQVRSIVSDEGFASAFDIQNPNMFEDPPIEEAKLRPLPLEASTLLDSAFVQHYPYERFILMWLAFEAVIHTHSGAGGNGRKRRRYFSEELGSQIVSDEVKRIFSIRNDTFKEGRLDGIDFDQACWSLYAALQLALLEDCPQRRAYLSGYEDYINTRPQALHGTH